MWRAYVLVTALRISAGDPAPVDYLEILTGDRTAAGNARADQLLSQLMGL